MSMAYHSLVNFVSMQNFPGVCFQPIHGPSSSAVHPQQLLLLKNPHWYLCSQITPEKSRRHVPTNSAIKHYSLCISPLWSQCFGLQKTNTYRLLNLACSSPVLLTPSLFPMLSSLSITLAKVQAPPGIGSSLFMLVVSNIHLVFLSSNYVKLKNHMSNCL